MLHSPNFIVQCLRKVHEKICGNPRDVMGIYRSVAAFIVLAFVNAFEFFLVVAFRLHKK